MPSIKLTYFQSSGRAEAPRLAFTIGDIPFEDIRLGREEFQAAKAEGKYPMGSLPVLEVDGKMVCQSAAITTYASKLAGLYPEDHFVAMKAEEVRGCLDDIGQVLMATFAIQDLDEKIAKRKELIEGKMGEKIAALEKLLVSNGSKCAVSDELCMADIEIYCMTTMITSGFLDGIPKDLFDKYERMTAISKAVAAHPKVAKWNADHAPKST